MANIALDGALGVGGATTPASGLSVSGGATVIGGLVATSASFSGAFTATGGLVSSGTTTLSGASQIGTATNTAVGFYGTAPVNQPTSSNEAAVTNTSAVSISATQWGYATSTQANAIVTLVNQIRSDLVTLGLIKGS